MVVLLQICCIFSEHVFPKNTTGGQLLKGINDSIDIVTATAQSVYRILEIMFKLVLFEMTKINSKSLIPDGLYYLKLLLCLGIRTFTIC